MKVKELVEELSSLDQELNVRIQADHGQHLMSVTWVGESLIEDENEYMGDGVHEDDAQDHHTRIIEIQGF